MVNLQESNPVSLGELSAQLHDFLANSDQSNNNVNLELEKVVAKKSKMEDFNSDEAKDIVNLAAMEIRKPVVQDKVRKC